MTASALREICTLANELGRKADRLVGGTADDPVPRLSTARKVDVRAVSGFLNLGAVHSRRPRRGRLAGRV